MREKVPFIIKCRYCEGQLELFAPEDSLAAEFRCNGDNCSHREFVSEAVSNPPEIICEECDSGGEITKRPDDWVEIRCSNDKCPSKNGKIIGQMLA